MRCIRTTLRRVGEYRHRLFGKPGLRWLAPWLDHPACWAMNRRKVAGGVALGLFTGLIPGPPKRLSTLALAVLLRVNLPAALLTTLYSNPFTILPLYFLAFSLGRLLLGDAAAGTMSQPPDWRALALSDWSLAMGGWLLSLGWPLLLGLLAMGSGLALVGYVLVRVAWGQAVIHRWQHRKASRGSC
ncbi:DUF2062 domain-containing protein [uncultured Aquitalea sp.]|uniref:DUF2062 domain-containing protein n=1 Tax=uncultured Aquitalea sp. TaxID=540272 RepID=UPI0025E4F94B|nr:DUF2062 domain-containing protein [uncultured Aquitalea sp.]